jgi:subtilisin family serine protease
VILRGNSFYDKVSNAQRSGALAAVIYNNESGNFNGTLSDGNSSTIPAVSISQENGNTLKASQLSQAVIVKNLHTPNVSGYDFYDGTSMATPHVSGVAALVWSKNLGLKAGDIRSLLQSTAEDLGSAGRDASFGYGLVRALNAVAAAPGGAGGGGDTTAPVISNVRSAIVNAKQATFKITWDTNEPATSTVTFANGGGSTDNTLATSHSVSFRGTKGATYTYTVSSTDAAGNASSSGPYIHQN